MTYEEYKQVKNAQSDTAVTHSGPKMTYSEYRQKTAAKKVAEFNTAAQRYFSDYQSFVNAAVSDSENIGYHNATSMLENRIQSAADLRKRADTLSTFLESSADILQGDYSDLLTTISSTKQGVNTIMDAFGGEAKYYSQWDTEEAYKEGIKREKDEAKAREDMLNFDLEAGENELNSLEGILDEYNKLILRQSTVDPDSKANVRLREIRSEYGSKKDIKDLISQKSAYLNRAKRLQESIQLASVSGNEDFDIYNGYVSTKSDGFWDKLTSQYSMAYDDLTYEYINGLENGMRDSILDNAAIWRDNPDKWKIYNQMKPDEISIYNYHYSKDGKEAADKYLDSIQETLNARKGREIYESMEEKTLRELAFSVRAGLDRFSSGVTNFFNFKDEYIPQTAVQFASAMVREDLSDDDLKWYNFKDQEWEDAKISGNSLGQVIYDVGTTTANMAPSMLASIALSPIAGNVLQGVSAAGNAYASALRDGYSAGQARAYSTLVGAAEGTLQYILGGIGSFGGVTDDLIKGKLNMIDNSLLRISAKMGVDVFSETFEEELQNFLEPTFRSIIFGEEYDIPTIDEMIETAIVSAGTTLLLGGSDTVSRDLSANKLLNATTQMANGKTNTPYNQEDIVKRLKDKGFNPEKSADMAEVIAARLNGQELTKTQTGRLRTAMDNAVVRDVISDVTKEKSNGIDSTQHNGYDETEGNENGHETVTEGSSNNLGQNALSEGSYEGEIKAIDHTIPNVESATINPKKLTNYALNPNHPVGGNKAKVFESALGYNQSNAGDLMRQIYEKLPGSEARLGKLDQYGQRYTVDILIMGPNGKTVTVRTGWITKTGSDIPELTTLYVKD